MPATGTGARFRIKVSENTNSDCKDAALSGYYSDVYDGQCNVFSNVASQDSPTTGAVAFGNSMFPVEYIAEFPMPDPPRFGEAELEGLELNLYFTDINQTNDYTTLNLEVYKLKEPLQTEGNFMALKSEQAGGNDIYFASSVADGKTVITENFSNAGDTGNIDLGAFKSSSGSYIYLSNDDAYAHQIDGDCAYAKDKLHRIFGSTYLGARIVRIKLDGDGPDWKSYTDSKHWYTCRPYFDNDNIKNKLQYKGEVMDNSDQDNTYLDITDTILEHLDQTVDYYIGDANDDRNYTAFSRPYLKAASSPTNGVVFSMSHYTSATEPTDKIRSYALSGGSGILSEHGGTYQEIRTYFSIPAPQLIETDWDDDASPSDTQAINEHAGVQVELVVNVNLMNSRSKKKRSGDGTDGSKSTKSDREGDILLKKQKIASMARSFIITLTDRPPHTSEKFHHFVWNIQKPTDINLGSLSNNPKLQKKGVGEMEAQRFYGIAFWNDGTPTSPNLRAITSGWADQTGNSNEMFFGSINKYWASGGGEPNTSVGAFGCPIYERTYDGWNEDDGYTWGYDPQQQLELAGNEYTSGVGLGTWFKVVMAYNSSTDATLKVYILDMNDNLINYAKFQGWSAGFTEGTSGQIDDFTGDSMPRYCTLWCLSEGIEANAEADYTKNQDTYTEVLVDSISIRGGEPTVNNATMGLHNISSKRVHLNSQPKEMLLFNQEQKIKPMVLENPDNANVGSTDYPSYSSTLSCPSDLIGKSLQSGSLWANSTEAFDSVLPNYLSFGFKHTSALDSSATHLFLGGYTCDSLNASDGTDAAKRPKTVNAWLGNQADVGRIMNDKATAKDITIDGTNYVDYFTRKGHFTVDAESPTWEKRENSFVSTRITDISRAKEGRIKVASLSTLLASEDEEYVIYRQTGKYNSWTQRNKVRRTGLKVKKFDKEDREIFFENDNGKLHVANNGTSPLCVSEFSDELYISPYRYWLIIETWNLGSEGDALPAKTYSHVLSQGSASAPGAGGRTFGMTYNEHLYSDSPKPSNQWEFSGETDSEFLVYENSIDYGYGTYEIKETGYLNTPIPIVLEDTHTKVDISSLVDLESERLKEVGSLVSLYIRTTANGIAKLHTGKVSTTANRPFLNIIYKDALPELSDFIVQPNEMDPFYPTYTWSTGSDDLWYGFLIQDDKTIEHQYHSAVAHIPLNETGTATYLHRYTNEAAFGGSRATATDVDKTTSIEGLAGNCLEFDGTTTRHTRFADNTYDQPSGEMSVVAHFVASAVDDTHYIVSKYTQFALYVDSSGYINAKVHYDTSNSVNLKSISLVPTDGATPVNAIVTLDVGIPTGNVKLFINGKLEDQSGVKTTDGTVSNWKIGSYLPDPQKKLDIGMADTDGSNSMDHPFEGKIEEIVIYNKAIYPVVPQTGELSLFKPITELTTAPIASGKSIVSKLFVKDYHNIRGTTVNQVTSSSMVAYRKSGVGLKTN